MDYENFKIFKQFYPSIKTAIFNRHGGVSPKPFNTLNVRYGIGDNEENVNKNRQRICDSLDIGKGMLISLDQVHSDKIIYVNCPQKHEIYGFDSMVTDRKGLFLMTQVADCQSVCMYDAEKNIIANVHNGWKGSAQNIVGKTINLMSEKFGSKPANIYIGVSPSLGPCHAEFSDPLNELPGHLHKYIHNNNHVNFWEATHAQCVNEGVPSDQIEIKNICTVCNRNDYFSYRAQNCETGRFGVIIGMP